MKGSYTNSDKYTLDVEGSWRDGVLTLQLIYAENVPSLTGNAYIFDFSKESIDLTYLNPKVYEIEHDGQWIPIKEFVRDAMAPFYRTIRNRLGGPVRIEFFPDGSMQIGVKAEGESTFTPVVGKHKYFYHERRTSIYWGFLSADVEGAKWMTKAILGGFWSVPYLFYSCVMDSDKYFAPFHFQERPKEEKSLLMTYEEPSMTRFRYSFYSLVLFHYGTEDADDEPRDMSYEETRKCLKVADLLSKKDIQFIYLRGVKDSLDE